jgi:hypothetical protein
VKNPVPIPVCEAVEESPFPREPWSGMTPRAAMVIGSCTCAAASAFLYAVDPSRYAVYPQCWFYRTTGLYCAGCGATRALYALLHGRGLEALHDNALFVAALPLIVLLAGSYLREAWAKNAWPERQVNPRLLLPIGGAVLLLMLLFTLARNLPGWPFDLLKPIG